MLNNLIHFAYEVSNWYYSKNRSKMPREWSMAGCRKTFNHSANCYWQHHASIRWTSSHMETCDVRLNALCKKAPIQISIELGHFYFLSFVIIVIS